MTKFNKGDKVRVICDDEFVPRGTVLTVSDGPVGSCSGGNYYFEENDGIILGNDLELVTPKKSKKQRLTDAESEIATLKSQVAELTAEVETLKAQPKPTEIAEMFAQAQLKAQTPKVLTPNEQRKAIVAEAKAFVEDVTSRNHPDLVSQGLTIGAWFVNRDAAVQTIKAEFIINADKRTVVALIRDIRGNRKNEVRAKAVAKYAPDDVFNADIGKAIALGRALGLDVSRFEQAVKPTEVVVGQVVERYHPRGGKYLGEVTVKSIRKTDPNTIYFSTNTHVLNDGPCFGQAHGDRIINDTDAKY